MVILGLLRELQYAAAPALWLHDAQHHECHARTRALLPPHQDVPGEEPSTVTSQMQGQQQWLAAREGSIPSNSQKTFVPEFFLLPFSWQMPLLCNWRLSSQTTSTGQANAHKVAAQQVFTFLRDCLSIKELILLLQVGSTEQKMKPPLR